MYSGNEEPTGKFDTFAARELQQSGHSSASEDVMEYIQRTGCTLDTLRKMNKRKETPTLLIL